MGYVRDLLGDQQIGDVRLEEVELSNDGEVWQVTIGFSSPQLKKETSPLELLRSKPLEREYRVITILAKSGEVRAMKIRTP